MSKLGAPKRHVPRIGTASYAVYTELLRKYEAGERMLLEEVAQQFGVTKQLVEKVVKKYLGNKRPKSKQGLLKKHHIMILKDIKAYKLCASEIAEKHGVLYETVCRLATSTKCAVRPAWIRDPTRAAPMSGSRDEEILEILKVNPGVSYRELARQHGGYSANYSRVARRWFGVKPLSTQTAEGGIKFSREAIRRMKEGHRIQKEEK